MPLNARGIAQAHEAAARLRRHEVGSIVSSPLGRARDTAAIVGAALGLPVEIDEALIEANYGDREGHPMAEWFPRWIDGSYTPAGGESFAALRARAVEVLNRRRAAMKAPLLVVAHGAFFRAVRAEMGLPPDVRTPNATPFLCEPPDEDGAPWRLIPG